MQAGLDAYGEAYAAAERDNVARKLGLRAGRDEDIALMDDLQALMQAAEIDMTLWFRRLADVDPHAPSLAPLEEAFYDQVKRDASASECTAWLERHAARVLEDAADPAARHAAMDAANPNYVLRNYLAQEAIDLAEQGDLSGVHALQEVMARPYADQPGHERYAGRRPDWARHRAGCSMLSCSS